MKFDRACPGSEFTGVVQDIDQNLLDLACLEIEEMIASATLKRSLMRRRVPAGLGTVSVAPG